MTGETSPVTDIAPQPFSWWSWRPGIRPLWGLLIGMPLTTLGLLLLGLGLFTLIAGILDSTALPGSSATGNLLESLALLLLGLVLLPYPALLTHWSWRDLMAAARGMGQHKHVTRLIERRSNAPDPLAKRPPQPGLMHTGARPWYGIAVQLIETETPGKVLTFRVREEQYHMLHDGEQVRITYSPNLHYLYEVERVE